MWCGFARAGFSFSSNSLFVVWSDDFLCRQECGGAKDAQWTSTPRFAICTQVVIYLDFVLVPNSGFAGLHHIALSLLPFLMQIIDVCVWRHVCVYKCSFLNGALGILWGILPLLGCCSCELHCMLFGLFHKIQMPLKIPGGSYHPNAKYQGS